ncbi:MAG: zinc-ribbon domain-containing protein [Deltaproteobacteria bacterium]|nr:zinc-ribbon domain-containing protein [Deltaproteobacteria bacterium]
MALLVITCESCGTKFRLDSNKLNKRRNKVRCSNCQSVFEVEQPEEDDLIHIEISEEENAYIEESDAGEEQEVEFPLPRRERVESRSSGKKFLIAGIAAIPLILIIALFVWLGGRFPIFKAQKPPVGAVKPVVTISDNLDAYYLENVHAGEVLVIEAAVFNKSSKPVSFVMVQGKLFNRNDVAVLTQSCYAGNPLTRRQIMDLKLSEIETKMMNREGRDLKDVRIPPDGEEPFVLVFHNLPAISTLTNYSVNVVSSQLD